MSKGLSREVSPGWIRERIQEGLGALVEPGRWAGRLAGRLGWNHGVYRDGPAAEREGVCFPRVSGAGKTNKRSSDM